MLEPLPFPGRKPNGRRVLEILLRLQHTVGLFLFKAVRGWAADLRFVWETYKRAIVTVPHIAGRPYTVKR